MVTQRQINSLKRRFKSTIKEVVDLLNEKKGDKEENVDVFIVFQENIEKQLQKYCKKVEGLKKLWEKIKKTKKSQRIMKALLLKQANYQIN